MSTELASGSEPTYVHRLRYPVIQFLLNNYPPCTNHRQLHRVQQKQELRPAGHVFLCPPSSTCLPTFEIHAPNSLVSRRARGTASAQSIVPTTAYYEEKARIAPALQQIFHVRVSRCARTRFRGYVIFNRILRVYCLCVMCVGMQTAALKSLA